MKILVIGGAGMIGGHAALHLRGLGYAVTIAGRTPPQAAPLTNLSFLQGDFVAGNFTEEALAQFDSIVFCAGADVRHVPEGRDHDQYMLRANGEAVAALARRAKAAGVARFIHIGSAYWRVAPSLVARSAYVRSRKMAAEGVAALAGDSFRACSLEPPFVVGAVPGVRLPIFESYVAYAQGRLGIPPYGPAGGFNFISCQSLSEAIAGALARMESGKCYLLGDENLSFAEYFGLFFAAVGRDVAVPSLDKEHPLLPDSAILMGRGNKVSFEPDADAVKRLGYRRNDVRRAVAEIVAQGASLRSETMRRADD